MLNIPVILGSIRAERNSYFPAKLLVERILAAGHTSQLVDFKELPLPFVDTPEEPSDLNKIYPYENVQKWSSIVDAADALIFVAPEYNHGYSAVLKNAIDWLYEEFKGKAVGLVGVSTGVVGGGRAVEQLRPIMGYFPMFDISQTVLFGKIKTVFDENGKLLDETLNKKVEGLLKNLFTAAELMKQARGKPRTTFE